MAHVRIQRVYDTVSHNTIVDRLMSGYSLPLSSTCCARNLSQPIPPPQLTFFDNDGLERPRGARLSRVADLIESLICRMS